MLEVSNFFILIPLIVYFMLNSLIFFYSYLQKYNFQKQKYNIFSETEQNIFLILIIFFSNTFTEWTVLSI